MDKIKRSLKYSLFDGIFANVMMGMSETFMAPYAIAMKASAGLIGLLSATPNLVSSLFQLGSAALMERFGSRKLFLNTFVLIQALMWVPIILIPFIFKSQPIYVVIFYTILIAIGALPFPAWSSLMSDHVPESERGRVFGLRNMIFGITNVICMLLAGIILYKFKFHGFVIIFSIAFIARLASFGFLTQMYEPKLEIRDEHRFTFLNFLKRVRKSNFGRFVLFVSALNFSVYLAAPFIPVYVLRELGYDYLTFTVITVAASLTMFSMMKIWGKYADNVGNVRILRLSSTFIPFIPILWLVSSNVYYLLCVQVFAGFFWAGFNLAITNFMYDAVTPEKRTRCIAYFNVVNGLAMFSGAMVGGFLSGRMPPLFGSRILALFLLSGTLRFIAASLFAFLREVRKVKEISNLELFYSIIGLRPMMRQGAYLGSKE